MNKDYAETYKEYKSGKYKYTKGFGKLVCYQGLDYIENILKNDKYYSEELEDGFIFIESYINCIEQQCKKQKEVIDNLKKYLKLNIELIKEQPSNDELTDNFILTRFNSLLNLLNEVSENE